MNARARAIVLSTAAALLAIRAHASDPSPFAWMDPLHNAPQPLRVPAYVPLVDPGPPIQSRDEAALARQLDNPISALLRVPIQLDFDQDLGADDEGSRFALEIEPVVPFALSRDWNLISRTSIPFVSQDDVVAGTDQSGLGDIVESLFFSPKEPSPGGWIWGVGPAFLIPTASEDELGADQWGAGPTAAFLKQEGPLTWGLVFNHILSFESSEGHADVNTTLLQPFLSYSTPSAWSYALDTESTYDWESEEWTVPIHLIVSKVLRLGQQAFRFGVGLSYWADAPDGGPEGFGLRVVLTPVFPQ